MQSYANALKMTVLCDCRQYVHHSDWIPGQPLSASLHAQLPGVSGLWHRVRPGGWGTFRAQGCQGGRQRGSPQLHGSQAGEGLIQQNILSSQGSKDVT